MSLCIVRATARIQTMSAGNSTAEKTRARHERTTPSPQERQSGGGGGERPPFGKNREGRQNLSATNRPLRHLVLTLSYPSKKDSNRCSKTYSTYNRMTDRPTLQHFNKQNVPALSVG